MSGICQNPYGEMSDAHARYVDQADRTVSEAISLDNELIIMMSIIIAAKGGQVQTLGHSVQHDRRSVLYCRDRR